MGGAYETTVETSTVKKYYAIAGMTVAVNDGSSMKYLLTDHLGSVVAITDASGGLLNQQRYLPFGGVRADVGNISQTDFGYTGQRALNNGLMDYHARFYDAALGRFVQPDTIIPSAANPQSFNRYSYALNNPIKYNDPSGHTSCEGKNWDDGPGCLKNKNSHLSIEVANTKYQNECSKGGHRCNELPGFAITSIAFPEMTTLNSLMTAIFGPPRSTQAALAGAIASRYVYNASTGQYRDVATGKFVSPNDLPYPPGRGFATDPANTTLSEGTVIDRFGSLTGRYASEPGISISARGMAPGSEDMTYTMLKVVKPVTVPAGPAAEMPALGAEGGGMQYFFEGGIQSWIDNGFLEIIP
jgi:RHS repeat-associated protein